MDKKSVITLVLCCGTIWTLCAQNLESDTLLIPPVVVKPGVNPAHRIIENAIKNRHLNSPEKRYSYRCKQYNKMIINVSVDSTARRTATKTPPLLQPDSAAHGIIMESVVSRTFMAPEGIEERVISSQTSGFKEYQQLSMLPSALQFFHFYDDVIEWKGLNQSYLNPISPHSTDKYFFLMQDTIVSHSGDSTFVISFQPKRLSNIDGLKGTLCINTNGWAIEKVVAEPATAALFPIKIEQHYRLVDTTVWFPHTLSFELSYNNFALSGLDLYYHSISVISDVEIDPDLGGRKVVAKTISIEDDAGKRPELIAQYRTIPLSQKELKTYSRYEHANYDWAMQFAEGAVDRNSLSFNMFDIPFNQVINYNYYEGWRFGMGLYTNRKLSPYFSVGGFYRYGLKDQKAKYGLSFSFFPGKDWDTEVKMWVQKDITGLSYSNETGLLGRGWMGNLYMGIQGKVQEFAPIFDYTFGEVVYDHNNRLRNCELEVQLRYAVHERRAKIFQRTYPLRADYPVFYLKYAMGLPALFKSDYSYQKVELGMQFNRFFRNFGRTFFSVWGGEVTKNIPVMMLFNQSYIYRTIFLSEESKSKFNVIVHQVYAANRYIHTFLYHDFGSLLYKTRSKVFAPRIAVAWSAGWSRLFEPIKHGGTALFDMQKGYFENGVVVEDIVRVNYVNLCYAGLGGALYGAYGGSVTEPFGHTLTPMIRLSVSF